MGYKQKKWPGWIENNPLVIKAKKIKKAAKTYIANKEKKEK
jgi:hypothetical protein